MRKLEDNATWFRARVAYRVLETGCMSLNEYVDMMGITRSLVYFWFNQYMRDRPKIIGYRRPRGRSGRPAVIRIPRSVARNAMQGVVYEDVKVKSGKPLDFTRFRPCIPVSFIGNATAMCADSA